MAKKKIQAGYAICGQCAQPIDLQALYAAQKADRPYVHYCGRVLHWGDENAEVPTSDLDDGVDDSDLIGPSASSSPSAGDA